jgi:hypothetical protein
MAFYFILSKRESSDHTGGGNSVLTPVAVYAISFLCTLNTRKIIRGKGTDREPTSGASANISGNQFYVSHVPLTNTSGYPPRGDFSKVRVIHTFSIAKN